MVTDVVRSYWQIAGGLTDGTRQRAMATARAVLSADVAATPVPGALGQVQSLTEELLAFAAANRELVRGLVAAEVDRALQAVGLPTGDDVAALRRSVERLTARVERLEEQLNHAPTAGESPAATATRSRTRPATKPAPRRRTAAAPPGTPVAAEVDEQTHDPASASPGGTESHP